MGFMDKWQRGGGGAHSTQQAKAAQMEQELDLLIDAACTKTSDRRGSQASCPVDREPVQYLCANLGLASERGPRPKNDDAAGFNSKFQVYAVADGIGGAPDGDVMSRVACGAALQAVQEGASLVDAFKAANEAAVKVSQWIDNPDCGTTLLLARVHNGFLELAWVGDTLAYVLRQGQLMQVTPTGRSVGNALEAAVGYELDLQPQTAKVALHPWDRILLCTDGVWETYASRIGKDALVARLTECDNAPWIAGSIAKEAADEGSDNATALVLLLYMSDCPPMDESTAVDSGFTPVMANTPVVPLMDSPAVSR